MVDGRNNNITNIDTAYAKAQVAKQKEQNRQVIFRRRRLAVLFSLAVAVFIFVGFQLFHDYQRMQTLKEIKQETIADNKVVVANVKELRHEVALLKDDDYVAKLARSRFFYSKDGEQVYPLPEQNKQTKTEKKAEQVLEKSQESSTTAK